MVEAWHAGVVEEHGCRAVGSERGTQIRLTAEGVALAEEAVIASAAAQHKLWDGLPGETVQRGTAALRALSRLAEEPGT